jgi:hypothetical protein
MPAIDLARLRKQANRLADFFFLPDDFRRLLRETLDFYVNRTLRRSQSVAPGSNLPTYRTPNEILRQIEVSLGPLAKVNPHYALELADMLWDEGYLETRLLAAFLLGCIPPQEERLLARLTAWAQQVRDPSVRSALLTTSLTRMRVETPDQFLVLIGEWLHPARQRMWSSGLQALLPMVRDPDYENLPPIFEITRPIIKSASSTLQTEIGDLINALFSNSSQETVYFLHEIIDSSDNPMIIVNMRRLLPFFPPALQAQLREHVRAKRN